MDLNVTCYISMDWYSIGELWLVKGEFWLVKGEFWLVKGEFSLDGGYGAEVGRGIIQII